MAGPRILLVAVAVLPALAAPVAEPMSAPPGDASPAGRGWSVRANGEPVLDLWILDDVARATEAAEELGIELGVVAKGAVLGRLRLHRGWDDPKGQTIPAGTYVLRYAIRPVDGAHMGVSDFRDFAVLVPADRDPGAPSLRDDDLLVDFGRAASGTPHPATIAIVPVPGEAADGLAATGDGVRVLIGTVAGKRCGFVVEGGAVVEGY